MKNKFVLCLTFLFLICFAYTVFAQDANNTGNVDISRANMSQNIMLARSSADYRVTPGDVYTLTYAAGTTPVSYIIVVDASYRIRVSNLGIINGSGKTFMQLKSEVETAVANNYPLSGVQLVLTQPAVFKVHVMGEVYEAGEVPAWALTRLSSLININLQPQTNSNSQSLNGLLTPFASLRDVSVQSANGQTRVYDLFKAQRFGDLSQDPYLRPGDAVTFNRTKRVVTLNGPVERSGKYQLLDEENIKELIESYGGGFMPNADKTRIELVRMVNSVDVAGDKLFLTENDFTNNYTLENYDVITVTVITDLQPVMFVEGAVSNILQRSGTNEQLILSSEESSDVSSSNRLMVRFNKGETYDSLVRRNIRWFTAVSDTLNAYIIRKDERIPINLNPMLYDASYRGEVLVQANDVLIIPFRQYFVTVAGAVLSPGRYPYIPDRDWEYYVALAGGFITERNARQSIVITDIDGKRMKKTDAISPETVITARTNHFLYGFNQVAPVVTTVLSIVSTFLAIYVASGGNLK